MAAKRPARNWGLIGASTIAREWMVKAIRAQDDTEIRAMMSRDRARGEAFSREFEIAQAYDSLEAMLGDPEIDAVYIGTTNDRHHGEVLAAAAAGKHVLCDKPIATSLAQASEMIAACERAGVTLAVNHHLRNAATHRAIRATIEAGTLGRIVTVRVAHGAMLPKHLQTWRIQDPSTGAGAVLDLAVHDADLLRFLLDDEIIEVEAMTANTGLAAGGIEDTAVAIGRTKSGTLISFQDVFNTPFNRNGVEIHGTEGSIFATNVLTQFPQGEVRLRDVAGERELPVEHEDLYQRGVRRFVAATRGEDNVPASGLDGARSLAVALAILDSAKTGTVTTVAAIA
ncbi:MAG: Gfo/Idh/MocA family oxidoreductase [Pseudomonadota bacterium]